MSKLNLFASSLSCACALPFTVCGAVPASATPADIKVGSYLGQRRDACIEHV